MHGSFDRSISARRQDAIAPRPINSAPERFSGETKEQRAKHREVDRRYAWDDRQRERAKYPLIVMFRLRDLETFFAHRYGETLPDDDAGRDDLYVMASHIYRLGHPAKHIPAWARLWCPWMGDAGCARLIAEVAERQECWTADELAGRIGLDDATRTLLKIKSIGAVDVDKAARYRRAKRKDAERHRIKRAQAGATPRELSSARLEPWRDSGVSRATYFRRQRKCQDACRIETVSSGGEGGCLFGTSQSQQDEAPASVSCAKGAAHRHRLDGDKRANTDKLPMWARILTTSLFYYCAATKRVFDSETEFPCDRFIPEI